KLGLPWYQLNNILENIAKGLSLASEPVSVAILLTPSIAFRYSSKASSFGGSPLYLIYSSSKVVACVLLPKRYLVVNSLSASFLAFFFFLELLKSSCVLNFSFSILFNLLFVNFGLLSDVNSSSTLFPVIFSYSFSVTFPSLTNFSIIFLA